MSRRIAQILTILLVSTTTAVEADYWDSGSWIDTGDSRMRHRLQYLGDNNLIKAPLTTWPLNTVDVYTSMPTHAVDPDRMSPHLKALYLDSRDLLKDGLETGLSPVKLNISGTSEPYLVRGFDDGPRDDASGYVDATYTGEYATGRLKLWGIYSDDKRHELRDVIPAVMGEADELRFDDSYLSVPLGNWVITPGAQTRWWGPGWDGSLIMSNNARGFPGISLERHSSRPFD
ncbi:MAG: capsule assembly Wzi family protein, partial [Pseudomonadota bacterium]